MNRFFVAHIFIVLVLSFLTCGCFPQITDVQLSADKPTMQKILGSAEEIRKLADGRITEQHDRAAKVHFERGLSLWKEFSSYNADYGDFDRATVKLFDAYIGYLNETKKISPAIETLRIAVHEAEKSSSLRTALRYRLDLAESLARIGQIETAKNLLAEAQALVDRVFGPLIYSNKNTDPFQLADNAAILLTTIRLGVTVDPVKLATFTDRYASSLETTPFLRYICIETPLESIGMQSHIMNDENFYRRDQEYWQWFAVGALRAGDRNLAKKFLQLMLKSAEAAEQNKYVTEMVKIGVSSNKLSEFQAEHYMAAFYSRPQYLKHNKQSDMLFGLETKFDSALAAAELYVQLDEPALAQKMIGRAKETLPIITKFSDELKSLGHMGLHIDQRTADIQRVSGKLLLKNQRWRGALEQLDLYIAWSESYRNNLSLEERLPYFRSQVQEVYFDALTAKVALYTATPTESNFTIALESLGKLKARHLRDSLDAGGKMNVIKEHSTKSSLDSIINDNKGFLSITDTGDRLFVFYADRHGKNIRTFKKPKDFDKTILSFRNNLAELQKFDAATAQKITSQTLGDLEAKVFGKEQLVVEIDGSLSFLPVELWLNSKLEPLGKETAVSYIPSLAMSNLSRTSRPVKGILAIGDARFDQKQQISAISGTGEYAIRGKRNSSGFSPLPETREEIISILKSVREGGKTILGEDATKSIFFQEARIPYRYLHFATHGVVGGEIPRLNEPALVLTPENKDPGFLTATEIGKMNIAADLVVLSACNTGNGEYFNGEGLMGLGRAFILAGAKSVVVSLWPVDSITTKDLMVKFYSELEVTGNATLALASARKAIMASNTKNNIEQRGLKIVSRNAKADDFSGRKNPFYWAPFVIVESGL